MKNLCLSILLFISFLALSSYNTLPSQQCNSTLHVINTVHVIRDTVTFTKSRQVMSKYFESYKDIVLFVRYVKTQSHRQDMDNWAVMKTMFNRMDDYGCTWNEYYKYKKYNHSASIDKMKKNPGWPSFDFYNDNDRVLFFRAIDASLGKYPEEIRRNIPPNVLYFESFPESWNANKAKLGIFNRDSINVKYRHEFYRGETNQNT